MKALIFFFLVLTSATSFADGYRSASVEFSVSHHNGNDYSYLVPFVGKMFFSVLEAKPYCRVTFGTHDYACTVRVSKDNGIYPPSTSVEMTTIEFDRLLLAESSQAGKLGPISPILQTAEYNTLLVLFEYNGIKDTAKQHYNAGKPSSWATEEAIIEAKIFNYQYM